MYICSENKSADQLPSDHPADLYLCFHILYMQKAGFLMTRLIGAAHRERHLHTMKIGDRSGPEYTSIQSNQG